MKEDFYNLFMAKRISKDRYLQITKYLHMQVADSSTDKLHKVSLIYILTLLQNNLLI